MMPVSDASENCRVEVPVGANARRSSKPKAPGMPVPPRKKRVQVMAAIEVLNPRDFVRIQALPDFGQKAGKVLARGRTVYRSSEPPREQECWENYHRRQKQLTQGYFTPIGKPYLELGEVLYLDPKKLTLYSLGQLAQEPVEKDAPEKLPKERVEVTTNKYSSNQESDSPEPLKRLVPFRETGKELRTLSKALARSSPCDDIKEDDDRMQRLLERLIFQNYQSLVSSRKSYQRVPTDESYPVTVGRHLSALGRHINGGQHFQILHQEALQKNTLKVAQQAQGTRWRTEVQPPKYSSDTEESDEEISICSLTEGYHLKNSGKKKKEKKITLRSLTPLRASVLIPNPPGAKSEHLFRQLCAIHWLLEASTLEYNNSMPSILTCWNPTYLCNGPWWFQKNSKRNRRGKVSHMHTGAHYYKDKGISQLSGQSSSHGQTPRGSITSTVLSCEDDIKANVVSSDAVSESAQAKEQQPSLQKVIQRTYEEVSTDGNKQEDMVKKTGVQSLLPVDQKNHGVNMPFIKEQESTISGKRRPRRQGSQQERCYQKYQALKHLKYFSRDIERIRQLGMKARREPDKDRLNWFPVLLDRLPESVKSDHRVQKILKKLEKYGKNPDLKIPQDTFVKVLGDLQVWELCSPEIAAAVEFVCESIVQMPEEEFSKWLQTRVTPLCA